MSVLLVGNAVFAMENDNNNNNNKKRLREDSSLENAHKKQRTDSNVKNSQDSVTLISKDGHQEVLPRSCAIKSNMINKLLLSGMKEAQDNTVRLPEADGTCLSLIARLLESDDKNRKKNLQYYMNSINIKIAQDLHDLAAYLGCGDQLEINNELPVVKSICNAVSKELFEAPQVVIPCKIGAGHTQPITALTIVGDKIVTGSADTTIKIWDANGTCLRTLQGHTRSIEQLESLGNNKLVSKDIECCLVWDINNGNALNSLRDLHVVETESSDDDDVWEEYIPNKTFITKDKIFSISSEKMAVIYKHKPEAGFKEIYINDNTLFSSGGAWEDRREMKDPIVLSEDYIFAVDIKNRHQIIKINLFDVDELNINEFGTSLNSTFVTPGAVGKKDEITALALVEDKLISGHVGGYITVWDALSGIVIQKIDCNKLDCNAEGIHSLLPVDKKLIIGSANAQAIHICNLETGEVSAHVLQGYDGSQSLAVYMIGNKLFYAAKDGTLNMVNGRTCCKTNITGVMNENLQIAVMGNKIIMAQADNTIKICDVSSCITFDNDPVSEFERFMKQQLPLVYAIFLRTLSDRQNNTTNSDQDLEILLHLSDTIKSNFGDQVYAIVKKHILQLIEAKYGVTIMNSADIRLIWAEAAHD